MSFNINQGFNLKSPQFNFERDYFKDLATLKAASEDWFPDFFITNVAGVLYQLDKSNSDDATTGKWRKLSSTAGNGVTVDSALSTSSANPVENKAVTTALNGKAGKSEAIKLLEPTVSDSAIGIAVTNANEQKYTLTLGSATSKLAGVMTASDKTKLDGIEEGATKTVVDTALSDTSTNPVQNKVVNDALGKKADATDLQKYLPLSGGTLTGGVTYGGVSISEDEIDVGNTAIDDTGVAVDGSYAGVKRTTYAVGMIENITKDNDIIELLFPDESGKLVTEEKVTEDFLQKDVAYGDTTITNKSVTVGKVALNPNAVYVDGLDSGHAEYYASRIMVTGINGFQSLSFPTTKSGTFALTSDIPDISGKADASTVNTELAKKLNTEDVVALTSEELDAILV